jgi:hypothetical protein
MEFTNYTISAVISALISTIIIFSTKTYLRNKIESKFNKELEKYKADIEKEKSLFEKHNQVYPKLTELIYRSRNICRDFSNRIEFVNSSLIQELKFHYKNLEEFLYQNRLDLEKDRIFEIIHDYKNLIQIYQMKISDILYFMENKETERAQNNNAELKKLYDHIDGKYIEIIEIIKNII